MTATARPQTTGPTASAEEAARAWLGEFFDDLDGGGIRLAENRHDGWREYARGVYVGEGDARGATRAQVLDALAAALVREADAGADMFACPYAHPGRRRQGQAVARRHVHADVDGPLDLNRVRALGGMAVASGSVDEDGRPHGHVYVRLAEQVPGDVHTALCAAMGRYVGGEHHDPSKVGDADVLRPAGTLNHKHGRAASVRWLIGPDAPEVRTWAPVELAEALGLGWPLVHVETAADEVPEVPVPEARRGSLMARLDGLARSVTEAPAGAGNGRLNWAAGVAAALCATAAKEIAADEVRAALVAAYMGRPVPMGETVRARETEAARTVASGWRWGTAHPARALAPGTDEHRDDESETVTATTSTTDDETPEVPASNPPTEDVRAGFWEVSPFYRSLLAFARTRRVGPWALLGAVLARASASVSPSVVLPPTIGGVASLNVFVALCSESGGGKSAAMVAAHDFLDARGGCSGYPVRSPGSGEGLLSQYVYVKREKGSAPQVVQRRLSVLFDVDEVGALGALAGRNGATLLPFLKTAWSGADLGTANAEAERDRQVVAHRYRLALVAGVQPVNAGIILDDEGGGFPQRWLWLPTHDPGRRDAHGVGQREALPWDWQVPGPQVTHDKNTGAIVIDRRREVPLPDEAVSAMLEAAEQRNRPIGAPLPAGATALDGHALLSRAKVAALLALLHHRTEVSAEDWAQAGVVLAVSDETRGAVAAVRGKEAAKDHDRKAARAGRSAAIAADAEATERTARAVKVMLSALERRPGEHSENAVRKFAGSRYRDVSAEALERLAASGLVEVTERESASGRRDVTTYYRWAVSS